MNRDIRGSSHSSEKLWSDHDKRSNGGGCIRQRRSLRAADDREEKVRGEQHHHAKQLRDTYNRHGDDNQSRRTGDSRGFQEVLPTQDGPMQQRKTELDHLQQQQ
eukprot:12398421-Heterocapsa_arctica.AAC.1